MPVHLWAFLGISLVVIITPGPDTVLVTKNAVLHGRRTALGTSLGVNTGLLIWTVAAALGVAAAVRASAFAFTALKIVGAMYLIYLGVQALRATHSNRLEEFTSGASEPGLRPLAGFRQGLFSDLSNPKIAVFFTSLLPQFVPSHESVLLPFLLLGALFVLITVVWLCSYAVLAARISDVLARPRVRAALNRVTGAVLVGLGIRLALEHR